MVFYKLVKTTYLYSLATGPTGYNNTIVAKVPFCTTYNNAANNVYVKPTIS